MNLHYRMNGLLSIKKNIEGTSPDSSQNPELISEVSTERQVTQEHKRRDATSALSNVLIEGNWGGSSHQIPMKKRSDGFWSVEQNLPKGLLSWVFVVKKASSLRYGSKYPARSILPQGGSLHIGAQKLQANIREAATFTFLFEPASGHYILHRKRVDAYAAYRSLLSGLSKAASSQIKNKLLQTFFQQLRAQASIPIRQGNRVVFLLWSSMKEPVYLAGSFNQWNNKSLKMKREAGTDFYHLEYKLPKADRYEYKFVDSSSKPKWMLDPYHRAFTYATYGPNSVVNLKASGKSHLEKWPGFQATLLKNKRDLIVYLPPSYRTQPERRFPVLYMHDGQNVFDPKSMWGGVGGR